MNLAFAYEAVFPRRGGAETYLADLLHRLVRDRHEVHLYAVDHDAASLPQELIHHPLPPSRAPRFLRPWHFARACEQAIPLHRHDVVVGLIKTWHQDVLIPQGGVHVVSARENLRKHASFWMRSLAWCVQRCSLSYWSFRWLEQKQYRADRPLWVVVPSRMVLGHLQQSYPVDPSRVRVIPNAIDADRMTAYDRPMLRAELRDRLGIHPEEVVGLFCGHNYRLKGLGPLLRAWARLKGSAQLIVCGGQNVKPYERLVRDLGVADQVHFLGFVEEVRQPYFAADFLVHPTFYDPCALVTLEALACGLPVITTVHNGAAELLPPAMQSHVISDPHDADHLAWHIQQFCDDAYRQGLARSARQAAMAWTFEDHYQALLELFAEVARRKQAA